MPPPGLLTEPVKKTTATGGREAAKAVQDTLKESTEMVRVVPGVNQPAPLRQPAMKVTRTATCDTPLALAASKPSLKSMISQICSISGTTMVTGLKSALRLSGSSVRPASKACRE
jgi:hypothetical protein